MRDDSEQALLRLEKLQALQAEGNDPYAIERYDVTHSTQQIIDGFEALEEQPVRIAGRVLHQRLKGKVNFADFRDSEGKIQLFVKFDELGEDAYDSFRTLDIGDIIGVEGVVFRTRAGEISVRVNRFTLLAKCLRPLPIGHDVDGVIHGGLTDVEQRFRMRYVDLIVNPDARRILVARCKMIRAIRHFLDGRDYLEVETPVLQIEAGGAAARPFNTFHNALETEFKLRISLELFLKRLIVGGLDRVYEIGRVFRNEGVSTRHNPEFTLLELYQAYTDLDGMMELVESMYSEVCEAVTGSTSHTVQMIRDNEPVEAVVDFAQRPWLRLPILEGIRQYAGIEPEELQDFETAKAAMERVGLPTDKEHSLGGIIEKLHERFTQPHLIQPTFITDFPIETSPLAKKHPEKAGLTRRFEVYVATQELGNAFSEINDPIDQRERFEGQLKSRELGDDEAHPMDEDFLRALEYGMPPTGGLGIGIDRFAMILTGATTIREVIFFPHMRPEA